MVIGNYNGGSCGGLSLYRHSLILFPIFKHIFKFQPKQREREEEEEEIRWLALLLGQSELVFHVPQSSPTQLLHDPRVVIV